MKKLVINQALLTQQGKEQLLQLCPFAAFEQNGGLLTISDACRLCGICVKNGPQGVITWDVNVENRQPPVQIDKTEWQGVAVLADTMEGALHPVTFELIGKARQLAQPQNRPVQVLLIGRDLSHAAEQLSRFAPDSIYVYDDDCLSDFRIEPYTAVAADFISRVKPSALLIGATQAGRSLAPRIAARFRTGLTADCTALEMTPDGDLIQIRPAFGGNIMARIRTKNSRPQLCTVRYKVFPAPDTQSESQSTVHSMVLPLAALNSRSEVLSVRAKPRGIDLTEAEAIIAVGRGLRSRRDLAMVEELAIHLKAELACTRPLIENGWFDPRRQIGLSGRTVSPKLLITLGISGSVQFMAGMKGSEMVIAVNQDPDTAICRFAQHALIGDLYAIVPQLLRQIQHKPDRLGTAVNIREVFHE